MIDQLKLKAALRRKTAARNDKESDTGLQTSSAVVCYKWKPTFRQ